MPTTNEANERQRLADKTYAIMALAGDLLCAWLREQSTEMTADPEAEARAIADKIATLHDNAYAVPAPFAAALDIAAHAWHLLLWASRWPWQSPGKLSGENPMDPQLLAAYQSVCVAVFDVCGDAPADAPTSRITHQLAAASATAVTACRGASKKFSAYAGVARAALALVVAWALYAAAVMALKAEDVANKGGA